MRNQRNSAAQPTRRFLQRAIDRVGQFLRSKWQNPGLSCAHAIALAPRLASRFAARLWSAGLTNPALTEAARTGAWVDRGLGKQRGARFLLCFRAVLLALALLPFALQVNPAAAQSAPPRRPSRYTARDARTAVAAGSARSGGCRQSSGGCQSGCRPWRRPRPRRSRRPARSSRSRSTATSASRPARSCPICWCSPAIRSIPTASTAA